MNLHPKPAECSSWSLTHITKVIVQLLDCCFIFSISTSQESSTTTTTTTTTTLSPKSSPWCSNDPQIQRAELRGPSRSSIWMGDSDDNAMGMVTMKMTMMMMMMMMTTTMMMLTLAAAPHRMQTSWCNLHPLCFHQPSALSSPDHHDKR